MDNMITKNAKSCERAGERGAALVTMLLISTLLLAAGGALIMTTATSTANTFDATAEIQAYYAAEAGMQAALNALRGNRAPSQVLSGGRKMSFRVAVTAADSNAPTDTSTTPRLSRWLTYESTNANARVVVSSSPSLKYDVTISLPPGESATDPANLLVSVRGYGPKGAQKKMEATIQKHPFDFTPPAAMTFVGGSSMTLDLANSSAAGYSGNDAASPPLSPIPAIAVASGNVSSAQSIVNTQNGTNSNHVPVSPATVGALTSSNTPSYLQSPDLARAFLNQQRTLADTTGRLFNSLPSSLANDSSYPLTFIDNYNGSTVTLGSGNQGSGVLIVTGNLDTDGNTSFNGIIFLMGRGHMTRSGGGSGDINWAIVIANFDPNDPDADTFGNPYFAVTNNGNGNGNGGGGGNSDIQYDSGAVENSLNALGFRVRGIIEN